jgi:hypothetical protein
MHDDAYWRKAVANQLLHYLREALRGDELLMKEVWEQCESSDDRQSCHEALERIAYWLEAE